MKKCEHKNFKSNVNVTRLLDDKDESKVTGYLAEIETHCADCFMPFEFIGLSIGLNFQKPTTCPDRLELRVPMKPIKK